MRLSLLTLAIAGLLITLSAAADTLTYNGHLEAGNAPANGRYDLRLVTHGDAKWGAPLAAPIEFPSVPVTDGAFRVEFELPPGQKEAWVELAVRAAGEASWSTIPGRTKAVAAPNAIGQCWSSIGDDGSNPALNFLGTTDAQPLVLRTRNVQSMKIEPSTVLFGGAPITANVIAGSSVNNVTAGVRGATISGGGMPTGSSDPDLFAEAPNRITDHYGVVSGGYGNQAGDGDGSLLNRSAATVAGGVGNLASGSQSSVGGGTFNEASGFASTVGGGDNNTASGPNSTVGGGTGNTAGGFGSTVSGGNLNCAGGDYSWVGGSGAGTRPGNELGDSDCSADSGDADGDNGTFVWAGNLGTFFTSTGPNQFLVHAAGGMAINTNTPAASTALTVAGNTSLQGNTVTSGSVSFGLAPKQMLNLYDNTFGIGIQTARMYFRVADTGGFSWFEGGAHNTSTDVPGVGGTLHMRLSETGQLQTTTGTISSLSDARLKSDVGNYSGALDQIAALRPVHYRYTDAGKAPFQPEGTHVGFIAQEVQQVFPEWVSEDESGYLMLSMRGFEAVAVRGMQELSAENALQSQKDASHSQRLSELEAENAELRARLERLEARLSERR